MLETSDGLDTRQAFVVIKDGDEVRVANLTVKEKLNFGDSKYKTSLVWDGEKIEFSANAPDVFLHGKPHHGSVVLKPGDEIQAGSTSGVVGINMPMRSSGRRALTHDEFKERVYEELARAARTSRPTALVMLRAKAQEGRHLIRAALGFFRAGDVVASYAPDEPEILLADIDAKDAQKVVKRLLSHANLQAEFSVVSSPVDGQNPERLMRAARQRLFGYQEKTEVAASIPVSQDPSTVQLLAELSERAKGSDPVLLTGEASTGKSVFARRLHEESDTEGAFLIVRCARVADDLDHPIWSRLEETKLGTVFLDDIAELGINAQAKLAAVLQSTTLRIVTGSSHALQALRDRGAFNQELFDLVFPSESIEVPPLRARIEDIVPLAQAFCESFAKHEIRFSIGALARMRSYPWPGNLLELRNAMERACRLAGTGEILAEHLPSEPVPGSTDVGRLREHVDSVERDAIVKALADANQNQTHAAKHLGISRRALIYKMEKYGLKRPPRTAK